LTAVSRAGTARHHSSLNPVLPDQRSSFALTISYGLLGLWATYLLLAPTTGFSWIESWHNEQRAVQIVLLSLTALVVAALLIAGPDALRARLHLAWWWWAFIALGSTSALVSQMPFAAFAEVGLFVLLSALVLLTAALASKRPEQITQVARYCALLIAVAHVLAVLFRYAASLHVGKGLDLGVFMLGYANPRFASALYAMVMPFIAAVAVDPRERRVFRVTALISLCLLWTINLGLGTRGIWFAYLLALPALMLLTGLRRSLHLVGAIVVAAVVGLAVFLALNAFPSGSAASAGWVTLPIERLPTLTSRDVLWSLAWNGIVQHPLLGLGPMHFAALKSYIGAHPHNWVLQVASEWGLPALALVLFALARASVRLRDMPSVARGASMEAALAVVVALAYGLVDGNLIMPVSQTAAALALGLALGNMSESRASFHRPRWQTAAASIVALVALLVVAGFARTSLADQESTAAAFREAYPREWLVPRLWEQGLLWYSSVPPLGR
jgi:O-antigen ligase